MKTNTNNEVTNTLEHLTISIQETNTFFLNKAQKQVNTSLTLRNWVIGYYIVEYEQSGKDRADYGAGLFKVIAKRLIDIRSKIITGTQSLFVPGLLQGLPPNFADSVCKIATF